MQQRARDQPCQPDLFAARRRSAECWCPPRSGQGRAWGRCSRKFINWKAMALSITVLRISLTLRRALSTPAMPPHSAARQGAGQERERQQRPTRPGAQSQRRRRSGQRANDQLAFGADVDHAAAEGDTDAQADQQQGSGRDDRRGKPVDAAKRAAEHAPSTLPADSRPAATAALPRSAAPARRRRWAASGRTARRR